MKYFEILVKSTQTQLTAVSILAVGFAAEQHLQTVPEHGCTVLEL